MYSSGENCIMAAAAAADMPPPPAAPLSPAQRTTLHNTPHHTTPHHNTYTQHIIDVYIVFICRLERDNAMLMGQYTKKAEEMQNEIIDLPDNVEVRVVCH